ncbi:hypothetical protein [Bacillus altitudinis]|uniref:hypothetical protein n=1 Tax=Bacillus altitudinis TaxID=293387 RepID=UPI00210094A1|nr:hypothetical protein [Bacillus altitudinis]UTV34854.1 hypothetical protein NM966_19870 [Bacillus altitudinis]
MYQLHNVSARLSKEEHDKLEQAIEVLNKRTIARVTKADVMRTALNEFVNKVLTDEEN